ncbi:flagellar rod assembly protein/muramidase FlgJ [Candidatus Endobugula sertula]|uniref:Peptidoglycan hydrolase FlgJ n=1 Tax=Candidatus Endobugula sertula TaxID=62101 RepID=A0A1D2QQH0_9GAMM|nr:flagellar rod assembly protein/muramidase FlgJ [Candidatus Endobugula sertula]
MDLHSLQNIRRSSIDDKALGLRQVAEQFESMFIQMMLKSMRSANDVFAKDNPLNSFESNYYRDMYDNQLSLSLSGQGIGLADALYRQLKQNYLSAGETDSDNKKTQYIENLQSFPVKHISGAVSNHIPQRIKDTGLINDINSPGDFIRVMTPYAKKAAKNLGVDYRVLVAQSALETGWGEHIIRDKYGKQSFNLFNIKADKSWQGPAVNVSTIEYVNGIAERENARFRRYSSIEDSFVDYQKFLSQPRYKKALDVKHNPEMFVKALHQAGYATDPDYSQKINQILQHKFKL